MSVTTAARTITAAVSAACLGLLVLTATVAPLTASSGTAAVTVVADGGTPTPTPPTTDDTHWG